MLSCHSYDMVLHICGANTTKNVFSQRRRLVAWVVRCNCGGDIPIIHKYTLLSPAIHHPQQYGSPQGTTVDSMVRDDPYNCLQLANINTSDDSHVV